MHRKLLDGLAAVLWLVLGLAFAERAVAESNLAVRLLAVGLALENALLALLFVLRRRPARGSTAGQTLLALVVTAIPLLLRPSDDGWPMLGISLQLLAIPWLVVSLLGLGTAIGVAPADRGLRTGGPYRLIRHPLYGGELLCSLGYLLANASLSNAPLWVLILAGQLLRIRWEERLLSAAHPEGYAAYTQRVRWRLLPYVY